MKSIGMIRGIVIAAATVFALVPTSASWSIPPERSPMAQDISTAAEPLPTSPTAYSLGETLAKLNAAELDTTFLGAIIPHHRAAIEMARPEFHRGASPDIRTQAENIIAGQRHQVDQFTRWLRDGRLIRHSYGG